MIPVFLDHRPAYLRNDCTAASLLSMPVGHSTLLGHLMAFVRGDAAQQAVVVPTFPVTASYEDRCQRAATGDIRIVESSEFPKWTETLESQEVICLVDPIRHPLAFFDLEQVWRQHSFFRGATHFVLVGSACDAVTEDLERDLAGRIRRIRRSYTQVAPPEVANSATFASIVRASAIQNLPVSSPAQLRAALSRKGVLASDVPLVTEMADLSNESGLLKLNDWALSTTRPKRKVRSRIKNQNQQSTSTSVSIHPSARLVGLVVVQAGSVVERDVTIVGPSVIGSHARVAAGSTVVHSLIASSTRLPPCSAVIHRVVVGERIENHGQEEPGMEALPVFSAVRMGRHLHGAAFRSDSWRSALPGHRVWAFVKRALDVLLSAIGLVVLSPVLLIVSILIKLDSSGPVLFCHGRESVGGKDFPCIKFRTMVADAHLKQRELYAGNEVDGPQFKLARDPRVTRLGNFLRKTNIDELPQLLNVIVGHMSLIGPRPSPFRENQICVPWRRARLSVRPGLSGLWQICRDRRDAGDFHQWIYFDLLYVQHRSLWLDVKILAATVLTLAGRWRVPLHWLIPRSRLCIMPHGDDRFGVQHGRAESSSPTQSAA